MQKGLKMTTLERAIEVYGADMQLNVAIEEFAELTKEICKNKRGEDNLDYIIEKVADCYIMLKQIELIFDIDHNDVSEVMKNKVLRLQGRLKKERKDDD